jgi:hypothetical protein
MAHLPMGTHMALMGRTHRRGIAVTALAMSACALGPASSAQAGAVGQVTTQVNGTLSGVNATPQQAASAVDGVQQATDATLQRAGARTRQSVDAVSGSPGQSIAGVKQATAPAAGSAAAGFIREPAPPAERARHLRMTSQRPEGAATSARAGLGIEAARGPTAPAPVAPSGSAGVERHESAGVPAAGPGILGLGIDDGGVATGATALLLSAFALMLMMVGPVPPALRSRLSVATGVRRTPPLILALDRPG